MGEASSSSVAGGNEQELAWRHLAASGALVLVVCAVLYVLAKRLALYETLLRRVEVKDSVAVGPMLILYNNCVGPYSQTTNHEIFRVRTMMIEAGGFCGLPSPRRA